MKEKDVLLASQICRRQASQADFGKTHWPRQAGQIVCSVQIAAANWPQSCRQREYLGS